MKIVSEIGKTLVNWFFIALFVALALTVGLILMARDIAYVKYILFG